MNLRLSYIMLIILAPTSAPAMEKKASQASTEGGKQVHKNIQANSMRTESYLPFSEELQTKIISTLTTFPSLQETAKALKALALTSKDFNRLVNDKLVMNDIITRLANKFTQGNRIEVAWEIGTKSAYDWFNTPAAQQWFKEFLKTHGPDFFNKTFVSLIEAGSDYHSGSSLQQAQIASLLQIGIDPNMYTDKGYSVLTWTLKFGSRYKIAEQLIKAGANPNARNQNGMTALEVLSSNIGLPYDTVDSIEFLLKNGANPNYINSSRKTFLQEMQEGAQEVFYELNNYLPDDHIIQRYNEYQKILELLKKYPAKS